MGTSMGPVDRRSTPARILGAFVVIACLAAAGRPSAAAVSGTAPKGGATTTHPSPATKSPDRPNILLIIADDFGVEASPCYDIEAEKPAMPTLEALCASGVVFDTVWVNPVCTPTRATLISGRYAFRTGVFAGDEVLADTTSIQDVLASEVGYPYPNAVIGKWHLGGPEPALDHPATFGVQHFAGFLSGSVDAYDDWVLVEDGVATPTHEYATSLITDKAIEWIAGQEDRPWFLWLAYNAPHYPYHLPPSHLHHHPSLSGTRSDIKAHRTDYFLAMAEALDTEMGRLLGAMPSDVRADTTIFFVADNGTARDTIQPPFDADHAKRSVYEGGVRVPLVVAGRDVTRHGEREDALINGVDIFATIARLGGYAETTLNDGVSFDQALSDPGFEGRTHIYTEFGVPARDIEPVWAVRDARYKYIRWGSGREELYDLGADPYERTNLVGNGRTAELAAIIEGLQAYHDALTD